MASVTTSSTPPLAGAHCPHCDATCVYEVPLELVQHGVTSVEISCHACGVVFATELPDLPEISPEMAPSPNIEPVPEPLPESLPESIPEQMPASASGALPLETPMRNRPAHKNAEAAPSRGRKALLVSITLLVAASIIGVGIAFMPKVDQTPLTAKIVHIDKADPNLDTPEQPTLNQPSAEPSAADQSPKPTSVPATGPASFNVVDSGYTISATELGNVMNISLNIKNTGGEAGRPNSIVIHLISPDGNILMSWPVPPGREAMDPLAERRYSAQLIEPPENVSSLQVALD